MQERYVVKREKRASLLPIYAITVGLDHRQEAVNRPIGAIFHHFMYVQDGEGIFETETGKYTVKKDMAVFIRKDIPIKYYGRTEIFRTAWITFDGSCVNDLLEYFSADDFSVNSCNSFFIKMLSCINMGINDTSSEQLSNAVYDLVVSYFTELNKANCPPPLSEAKSFISKNYEKDLSVADISSAVGICPSLLFRIFKTNEKCTPIEYLRQIRIEKAKSLLSSKSTDSIGQIGNACGFADTSYFCKVFKDETGISPNQFRELYKI